MGMRNTNDIIRDLDRCVEGSCQGCAYEEHSTGGECWILLQGDARYALTDMQDRCARYAEEIMVLRETLKKVRGGWRDVVLAHALRCSSGVPTGKEDCEHCKYGQRIGDASDGAPLPDELIAIADEWTCDCDRIAVDAAKRLEELGVMVLEVLPDASAARTGGGVMERLNCLRCQYRHDDNGNCTAAGGFCTAVSAAHCRLLQEYLGTGLTPEGVEALMLSMMGKAVAEIKEFDGLPIDRLKELAEADKEGRVEVLPDA